MAIIDRLQFSPCDDASEPDDFRPRSKWAVAVDPASPDGRYVRDPAGTAHDGRNVGSEPWRVLGVFPAERVGFEYLERNPAPGTEGDPPQPAYEFDVRAEADALSE